MVRKEVIATEAGSYRNALMPHLRLLPIAIGLTLISILVTGCQNESYNGRWTGKPYTEVERLTSAINQLPSTEIVISDDYVWSEGERQQVIKKSETKVDGKSHLVITTSMTRFEFEIIDANTLKLPATKNIVLLYTR